MDGKTDRYGELIEDSSLKYMMSQLYDYAHEETKLQKMGRLMGVVIDRTPKCHCEMAGEGIEYYSWGCAKKKFRRLSITERRKKETFHRSVQTCLKGIEKRHVRLFSRPGTTVHGCVPTFGSRDNAGTSRHSIGLFYYGWSDDDLH